MTKSATEVLEELRAREDKRVRVAIADVDGVLRGKFMHIDKFLSAARSGFGFCDVVFGWDIADKCYDKIDYTGWHSGYPDAEARVDLSTYRRVPWMDDVPFFLADFVDSNGDGLSVCPRRLLRRVVEKAQSMGFLAKFGIEFEWFNFDETPQSLAEKNYRDPKPITPGMFGYSLLRSSLRHDFFIALMDQMLEFGVPIEGLHTETGPGVYEVAITVTDALEAADRAVLFKTGAKEIGYRFGVVPTFMARWNTDLPGCSGHMHQSLWRDGKNAFYDAGAEHSMSAVFRSYLAGQMALLPELLPCYAPTINSYKRLVEGFWAPTTVTWAVDNRTAALRVIPGSPKSTRLETRVSGSDINPYLSVAAALASGLHGIEAGLDLVDEPVVGNAYTKKDAVRLPRDLRTAAEAMHGSTAVRSLFGDAFVDHYTTTRIWEVRQFQAAVTDWELQRYFELV
jgi:glutamine synthetase